MDDPSVTVTLLLTDLEGSTRLWQRQPRRMPEVLTRPDDLIRGAVKAEGGVIVKHTGDGMVVMFRSAHAAACDRLLI